jgi:hypothetical protein
MVQEFWFSLEFLGNDPLTPPLRRILVVPTGRGRPHELRKIDKARTSENTYRNPAG